MKEFYSQYFLLIWPASERAAILCLSLRIWHMCWETLPQGHRAGGTLVLESTLWTLAWWLMESPQTILSLQVVVCSSVKVAWVYDSSGSPQLNHLVFSNSRREIQGILAVEHYLSMLRIMIISLILITQYQIFMQIHGGISVTQEIVLYFSRDCFVRMQGSTEI